MYHIFKLGNFQEKNTYSSMKEININIVLKCILYHNKYVFFS